MDTVLVTLAALELQYVEPQLLHQAPTMLSVSAD